MHAIFLAALVFLIYNSDGSAQSLTGNMVYKKGDPVPLYANKVGPFANPSEQYEFYTLPFCAPKEEERKGLHLGEVLGGDRMMKSLYSLPFLVKFTARTLCSYTLQPKEIELFQRAIDADYFFELIYDGIPVRGFIGERKKEIIHGETVTAYHLFTHYIFSISHNGEKILGVRWEHDPFDFLDITDKDKELDVHFKYSSKWLKATGENNHMLGTPADQEHLHIRWFSILNSIGTVLLLTGFLAVILMRVLRNDISRYALMEQGGDSAMTEETGWKLVHGDVFRPPPHPELLCAVLGNGMQLLCIVIGVLLLALLGVYSHYNRGALLVASLVRNIPALLLPNPPLTHVHSRRAAGKLSKLCYLGELRESFLSCLSRPPSVSVAPFCRVPATPHPRRPPTVLSCRQVLISLLSLLSRLSSLSSSLFSLFSHCLTPADALLPHVERQRLLCRHRLLQARGPPPAAGAGAGLRPLPGPALRRRRGAQPRRRRLRLVDGPAPRHRPRHPPPPHPRLPPPPPPRRRRRPRPRPAAGRALPHGPAAARHTAAAVAPARAGARGSGGIPALQVACARARARERVQRAGKG